ncbi:MAG: hypothetical protein M3220_00430, partial [Chloroflexota bacterium]|nr:hypothetical protein [Chloroflexota bacterium]
LEGYRPFSLVRPNLERFPEPFYLERHARQVEQSAWSQQTARLTPAERTAAHLLKQAREEQYVLDVRVNRPPTRQRLEPSSRVSRAAMFTMGIEWASVAANTIIRQVIAPTRFDSAQPNDSLVQTTLYVVASLAEPQASALLWPIVSELVHQLGTRNLVNVVAILATGTLSLTEGELHQVEEAATYVALEELEALTGVESWSHMPGDPSAQMVRAVEKRVDMEYELRDLIASAGMPAWEERVGKALFNRIFLLDQEKSNQSLVRDSLELAVLAGNAIEAFLVANGATYLETQLGPDMPIYRATPYSILGAASEYVPTAEYMIGTIREEQKRIVREEVLQAAETPPQVEATLSDLGIVHEELIHDLLYMGDRQIFEHETASRPLWHFRPVRLADLLAHWPQFNGKGHTPEPLPPLRVTRHHLFSQEIASKLRKLPTLRQWEQAAGTHFEQTSQALGRKIGAERLAEKWGLTYCEPAPSNGLDALLEPYRSKTRAARQQDDTRLLPTAIDRAVSQVVSDICSAPGGLLEAEARVASWMEEAKEMAERIGARDERVGTLWESDQARRLSSWQQRLLALGGHSPRPATILIPVILASLFVTALALVWVWQGSGGRLLPQQLLLVALAGMGAVALVGSPFWLLAEWRIGGLQRQRVALAQEQLSRNANRIARDILSDFYRRLWEELQLLHAPLQEAIEKLQRWSEPNHSMRVPPPDVDPVHLRKVRANAALWQRIRQLVEEEETPGGKGVEEHFRTLWQQDAHDDRSWRERGHHLAQRVRLALEVRPNERDLSRLVELVGEEAAEGEAPIRHRLHQGSWCAYADGVPNQLPDVPGCTACPDLGSYSCPFSEEGKNQRTAWSLDALVLEYVNRATEHLVPNGRMLPDRPQLIGQLLKECSIERILGLTPGRSPRINSEPQRAYLDALRGQAKVSANYDMASNLSHQPLAIDIGVTADGDQSGLQRAAQERNIQLLASYDPTAITVVRTVNYLALEDTRLFERCREAYWQLGQADRKMISLLQEDPTESASNGHENKTLLERERAFL